MMRFYCWLGFCKWDYERIDGTLYRRCERCDRLEEGSIYLGYFDPVSGEGRGATNLHGYRLRRCLAASITIVLLGIIAFVVNGGPFE